MNSPATLWTAFAAGDMDARDTLIRENLSLVHHVAQQLARSLSTEMDIDELVSAGTFGLIQAIESFDATRGLAFSTLAVPRIRGAILDELRRLDNVPRSIRRRARDIAGARDALGAELGRAPSDGEIADRLGIDKLTLWRWEADLESGVRVPLERTSKDDSETAYTDWETSLHDDAPSIEDVLTAEAEQDKLREALGLLKEQERTVLALYYYEELKMHQIASVLGLTESRVSQIRSRAITRLRSVMAPVRQQGSAPVPRAVPARKPMARKSGGATMTPSAGLRRAAP
ncbi:MAG: FliA/WhiG family RNA polymerase sigma factor [Gemmatimonadales bacterium]|nr:FliA/WhiG family RNA polymerase sigma factor [Gemmatimonadota bacterium]MCL4214667.1 FliA/WhiG family RNA polymerase sigma factor [Gemmatimonadales bacterium]